MTMTRDEILAYASELAATQPGGTLATVHAEDGTPYVTYVLFHLRPGGEVIFASMGNPQHARNLAATPEASFLIDNRETVHGDWSQFDRAVIEGHAGRIEAGSPAFDAVAAELAAKDGRARQFTENGQLFVIRPRRILLTRGLGQREKVEFEE
jgi:putative heme iron utilization protein